MFKSIIFGKYILVALCLYLCSASSSYSQAAYSVVDLKCEYLQNPLGIDTPAPRFIWRMDDNRQGARQTAYCILVDTDSLALTKGKAAFGIQAG